MGKKLAGLVLAGSVLLGSVAAAAPVIPRGTMIFVPLDTRPVSSAYTVETMRAAGWDILLPPEELLSSNNRNGKADALLEWLEEKAPESVAVVASGDALLYGGLVDSRTHHFDKSVLSSRAERILSLKNKSGNPDVYVFVTIMRSPRASSAPVEPVYYAQWGPKLFRQGALRDKQDLGKLSAKERKELQMLNREIPADIEQDFYRRRKMNIKATELLLHGVESNNFDYLLIGRDDTAPLSQAHKEARHMATLVSELPKEKIRFFSGADQLGLLLLTRAANKLMYVTPFVHTSYAPGKGGETVPTYEDDPVAVSAREHIFAAGCYPVPEADRADFQLKVNTPYNGVTLEAGNAANNGVLTENDRVFLDGVMKDLDRGRKVIVADIKYGNGADNALVKGLFRDGIAWDLAAYGGWNTAGNALGFALGQGVLSPYMTEEAKDRLLTVRYLDDWAYQANARGEVYQTYIWPNYLPNSGFDRKQLPGVEERITQAMYKVAEPVMGPVVDQYGFTLPWHRMFEVEPVLKPILAERKKAEAEAIRKHQEKIAAEEQARAAAQQEAAAAERARIEGTAR
mgnify:FL=1